MLLHLLRPQQMQQAATLAYLRKTHLQKIPPHKTLLQKLLQRLQKRQKRRLQKPGHWMP